MNTIFNNHILIYVHSFRFAISEKELYKVYVNLIELIKIKKHLQKHSSTLQKIALGSALA